jgi:hypothetical protein
VTEAAEDDAIGWIRPQDAAVRARPDVADVLIVGNRSSGPGNYKVDRLPARGTLRAWEGHCMHRDDTDCGRLPDREIDQL